MNLTLARRKPRSVFGGEAAYTVSLPTLVGGLMSWQAVTWVLENSEATLGSRLTLLSIASHANREGMNAFPSLDTIAKETLLSRREIVYAIQSLEERGELRVKRGVGRGNPSHYELPRVLSWLEKVQSLHQSEKPKRAPYRLKGAIHDTKRCNPFDSKPKESTTSSEEPLEPSKAITVKEVAKSLSMPRTVKTQTELRAERDRQMAAMREKGYIQ